MNSASWLSSWLPAPWPAIVHSYLLGLPMLLATLVGIACAIANWRRAPGASGLVLAGCSALAFTGVVGPIVFQYVIQASLARGGSGSGAAFGVEIWSTLWSACNALGLGLLIAAAFFGRARHGG